MNNKLHIPNFMNIAYRYGGKLKLGLDQVTYTQFHKYQPIDMKKLKTWFAIVSQSLGQKTKKDNKQINKQNEEQHKLKPTRRLQLTR